MFEDPCPRCGSPAPHLHPAVQEGGEVSPCYDVYHERATPENTPEKILEHIALMEKLARG